MRTGSCAPAIAVFISTASQPSSIASAASDAVPTPASTMIGSVVCSTDDLEVVRVADAQAAADRRRQRHDRRAAQVLEPLAVIGSSVVYGSTVKPSFTSCSPPGSSDHVGEERARRP